MKRITVFFLLLLACISSVELYAQACMDVDASKGCIPFTVNAINCSPSSATPAYNYDYTGNPNNFTYETNHTYTTTGTYRICQFIGSAALGVSCKNVQVVASPDPVFTLKSCINRNVDVVITDTVYDTFVIDFGEGAPVTAAKNTTTTHTYTTEGLKSITVSGAFLPDNVPCGTKTSGVYALTAVVMPDLIDLHMLKQHISNGSVKLNFNGLTGQSYRIDRSINNSAFIPIDTIDGVTGPQSYTDLNLNTQTDNLRYQIVAFNTCGTEIPSASIYSVRIQAAATNALNTVTWNTSLTAPVVNSFELKRNSDAAVPLSAATTNYPDNTIICGSPYTYQTTAILSTNTLSGIPHKSYSIDTTLTAISTTIPPKLTEVNATMSGNQVTISWTNAPGISSYNLYVSTKGSAYTLLAKPGSSPYSYDVPSTSDTYCYELDYMDKCSNTSPKSNTTCPVVLAGVQTGSSVILTWNPYSGYNNTGVLSYTVQKLDEAGTVLAEIPVGTNTTYSETVTLTEPYLNYRIKVTPANTSFTNYFSNNSFFKFEAQVFVPDIFTPNGDGSNDYFIVKSKYVSTYAISIFTRWGEVVYTSTDMNDGWNGMNNTEYAQEGAYTYKITGTDIHNKEFIKTGTITLVR